jgi:hypothetical protein
MKQYLSVPAILNIPFAGRDPTGRSAAPQGQLGHRMSGDDPVPVAADDATEDVGPERIIRLSSTTRIESFSDGVMAIAITLLILDVRLSERWRKPAASARPTVAIVCRLRRLVLDDRGYLALPPFILQSDSPRRRAAAVGQPGAPDDSGVHPVPDVGAVRAHCRRWLGCANR